MNDQALTELTGLIEKLQFGVLDISLDLHNKRITASTVFGKKRNKYAKDNLKAVDDIVERLTMSANKKETTTITFVVNVRNGWIDETMWLSKIQRKYEDNLVDTNKSSKV